MFEQSTFEDAPPAVAPAPSAWEWARKTFPGSKVIRVIDLHLEKQAFAVIAEEVGLLVDGGTYFRNVPPGGLGYDEERDTIREYDIAWRDRRPAA